MSFLCFFKIGKINTNEFVSSVFKGLGDRSFKEIIRNDYGKPFLKDYPHIHFNVSHTNNLSVLVLSSNQIGIDIEKVRPCKPKIVHHCFTLNEANYVYQSSALVDQRFLEVWTKKEAYVKFLGVGMSLPFDSFDVFELSDTVALSSFVYDGYLVSICWNST